MVNSTTLATTLLSLLQMSIKLLHDEMLHRGLVPDEATYDILVNGKAKGVNTLAGALQV